MSPLSTPLPPPHAHRKVQFAVSYVQARLEVVEGGKSRLGAQWGRLVLESASSSRAWYKRISITPLLCGGTPCVVGRLRGTLTSEQLRICTFILLAAEIKWNCLIWWNKRTRGIFVCKGEFRQLTADYMLQRATVRNRICQLNHFLFLSYNIKKLF